MTQDVLLNKAETIRRCLKRIHDEYEEAQNFEADMGAQDAITLNLLRACEASIDMAAHMVKRKQLGIPQYTREVFVLLEEAEMIPAELSQHLQSMVGFRNLATHDYKKISLPILKSILKNRLSDFEKFIDTLLRIA